MGQFSERCKTWLDNNTKIDPAILEREINRFTKKLAAFDNDPTESQEQEATDLIDTLNLLETRLSEKKLTEKPSTTLCAEPLYDLNIQPEHIDTQTKEARLKVLLQNNLIHKGTKNLTKR